MSDYERQRQQMVDEQLAARGVRDERVLRAMREVPRERFVPAAMADCAYDDSPLPIEERQTISQPYIVAAMIEAAAVGPDDSALEVGAGSGYAAAVLSRIAKAVRAIERHERLVRQARQRLDALGYSNIELRVGDGTRGWPEAAPFDAILVAASGPQVPSALKTQLRVGGRLLIPVGDSDRKHLLKITRVGPDSYARETLMAVAFVPLVGEQGWAEGGA